MADNFGVDESKITAENISSTVSNEMRQDAVVAVIVATIFMLLYIWFRFKDIRFATSAVTALLHDVLVVLAFYAVARISVGNTFIACMLTIVGYSINATIVIFDRIREELHYQTKSTDLAEVVNKSITTVSYTHLDVYKRQAFAAPVVEGIRLPKTARPVRQSFKDRLSTTFCLAVAAWIVDIRPYSMP